MGHVRDGDHQPVAVADAGHVHGVVEVPRILAVDGDERQLAQIAAAGRVLRPDVVGHALRSQQGGGIELVGEAFRIGGGEDLEPRIAARAEVADDLPAQRPGALAQEAHLDQLSVLRARIARHRDGIGKGAIVRLHPGGLGLHAIDAIAVFPEQVAGHRRRMAVVDPRRRGEHEPVPECRETEGQLGVLG